MPDMPLPRPMYFEEFLPLVGQAMLADCDPDPVSLHLVEATPLANHAKLDRAPFILIFRSAPDALLVTGNYVLRGAGFGPDLVQIAQTARPIKGEPGHYYQAVFN